MTIDRLENYVVVDHFSFSPRRVINTWTWMDPDMEDIVGYEKEWTWTLLDRGRD